MGTTPKKDMEVVGIPNFWSRAAEASRRLLILDYDGTLAPFRENRLEAYPAPGALDALRAIDRAGATFPAIVSGRPLSELTAFLGDLDITLVGSHGFELKRPGCAPVMLMPGPSQLEGLESARRIALGLDLGALLETKAAGIALHTRSLSRVEAARTESRIQELWSSIAPFHGLRSRFFNGGVELVADGWNKGDAVSKLMNETWADFCVYVGDDTTDEDVFETLDGRRGVGIKVGAPGTPTAATGFLNDCQAVREFLETWRRMDTGGRLTEWKDTGLRLFRTGCQ